MSKNLDFLELMLQEYYDEHKTPMAFGTFYHEAKRKGIYLTNPSIKNALKVLHIQGRVQINGETITPTNPMEPKP